MNMINSLVIEGNVAKEITTSADEFGMQVGELTISSSRFYKDSKGEMTEEKSFFDVVCYGMVADYYEKEAKLGRGIRVVGRLKQTTWTDSEGKKHSRVVVIAEHVEFKPMPKNKGGKKNG